MNRLTKFAFLALASLSMLVSCGNPAEDSMTPPSISLIEGKENVWLDRYEEVDVPLAEIKEGLVYEVADPSVASVKKDRLYAEGVGETDVTVSDGQTTLSFHVRVRDSGVRPTISFRALESYLNTATPLPQEVSYNGKLMATEIAYTVDIADPSVVSYEGGMLKGLTLGSTKCNVRADWKGLSLARRDVTIDVKERLYITASTEDIELYQTTSKLGYRDLDAIAYDCGAPVGEPVTYAVTKGTDVVRLEGNRVYAVKEGDAEIEATYTIDAATATWVFRVHVGPNYVESDFFNPEETDNTLTPASDPVGNRQGVYYYAPSPKVTDNTCFASHVVEASRGTTLVDLYREGKRYLAYDVYWSSNENMMVGTSSLTSWIGVGSYFRKDYLSILKDGEVTNVLEKNTWVTMVYDLRALWLKNYGLSSYFFFFINDASGYAYLTKPRFYLDDSFLPSENRVYEKMDGFVQATNDEFDVEVPVSKGYRKGSSAPSLVVKPEEVPTYGPSSVPLAGREGAYSYKTFVASSIKNALVVSTSMNETYDDSLYRLSKLGSHFAFDIYPTKSSTILFQINGDSPETQAILKVGETSLSAYESWLVVYAGGERLNTLEAGRWQTVAFAFADNYLEDCYSGSMRFASGEANDEIYVDNCRYYEDASFLPNSYAPERRRPEAVSTSTSVTRLLEGPSKGAYEISSEGKASVSFSETGADGEFFVSHYRYLRFDLHLDEGVTKATLKTPDTRDLVPSETIPEGLTVLSEDGHEETVVKTGKWLTVYVPVGEEPSALGALLEIEGGSSLKGLVRRIGFVHDVYGFYLRDDQPLAQESASLTYETEGEFAGSYRYVNKTSGELTGSGQNWGEAGVYFDTLNAKDCSGSGMFFENGFTILSMGVYFEPSVSSFSLRATADRNFNSAWYRDIKMGQDLPSGLAFIAPSGERVRRVEPGVWYTMVLSLSYTSTDTGYTCITLYTNGGSEASPSVLHLKDLRFHHSYDLPAYESMAILARGDYGSLVSCRKQADGTYLYTNATPGSDEGANRNWGESGVYFDGVTNPAALTAQESTGAFFEEGYHYIKLDVKFLAGTSFSIKVLGQAGFETYFKQNIAFGAPVPEDVLLYEKGGTKAGTLEFGVWYTLVIPVLYDQGYANWTEVALYLNGGSPEAPSSMLLGAPSFYKESPAL